MAPALASIKPMVLLIGNYPLDRQQSMQRFGTMMLHGLIAAEIPAELIAPEPFLGKFQGAGSFVAKWLGYIDKFVLFPPRLRAKLSNRPAVVHICDHSNAVYRRQIKGAPVLITCHDLLAVRGALGEETDCPASFTGKLLQRWILRGLRRATAIACVSRATRNDAQRLLCRDKVCPNIELIALGLNYPYRKLPRGEALGGLTEIPQLNLDTPFALHVGSNLRRKNREGVLRIFARCQNEWNGKLVLAGDPLSLALRSLAKKLGISDRIIEVPYPGSETLEVLYNCAIALIYPSRFEGFGWPIAEAQACGCPVICSNAGPLPEVAGDAALIHSVDDEEGFAADLLRLTDPTERKGWSEKSLRNAERFSTTKMITRYIDIYRNLGARL